MKRIISFGSPSLFLFFPFVMPIFYCLRTLLEAIIPIFPSNTMGKDKHPIFITFLVMVSNFLMGIPLLITYLFGKMIRNFKGESPKNSNFITIDPIFVIKTSDIDLQFNATIPYKGSYRNSYLLILLSSFFIIIILLFNCILYAHDKGILIGYEMNIALLIMDAFLSSVILKYPIFRHQKLAIGLTIIGIILVCLNAMEYTQEEVNIVLLFLGVYVLISIVDISEKWLMEKRYFSPLKLIFYIGSCGMCIFFVIFCITCNAKCPPIFVKWNICSQQDKPIENIFTLFAEIANKNSISFLYMILVILAGMGYLVCFFFTNYYFSPCHRCMSDIMASLLVWILGKIFPYLFGNRKPITVSEVISSVLGYLIILFAAFIYNEIIILYIFDLHRYTKKEINLRGNRETLNALDFDRNNNEDGDNDFPLLPIFELNDIN